MNKKTYFLVISLLLLVFNACKSGDQLRIPGSENITVTLDGIAGPQEWDNSLVIPLEHQYSLHFMADSEWLYIAAFGHQAVPYTDIYIKTATGIINLHASMQLGERVLENKSWDDVNPPWNWGNNTLWTANTVTYKSGASENLPFRNQVNSYQGQEFKIALSKLGSNFSFLVVIQDFVDPAVYVSFPVIEKMDDVDLWQAISVAI